MIELILAVALGNPCLAPPPRKHHVVRYEPVQTCVTPPVQMCFKDVPELDLEPVPMPLIYYVEPPVVAEVNSSEPAEATVTWTYNVGADTYVVTQPGYVPQRPSAQKAPELGGSEAGAALTLLAGCMLVIRGGKKQ